MVALGIYESGVGPCGFHHSLTGDRSNFFTFEDEHCPVCRAVARQGRVQAASDKKALDRFGKDGPPPETYQPGDGRRTFVRLMDPLEVQARRQRRPVTEPGPQ